LKQQYTLLLILIPITRSAATKWLRASFSKRDADCHLPKVQNDSGDDDFQLDHRPQSRYI